MLLTLERLEVLAERPPTRGELSALVKPPGASALFLLDDRNEGVVIVNASRIRVRQLALAVSLSLWSW